MSSLFQYKSNRLKNLAGELAKILVDRSTSPLEPEVVVVPSLGLRRWLNFELAQINAVCANVSFPFLAEFVNWVPAELAPPALPSERIPPEEMVWAIHRILPTVIGGSEFQDVSRYLSDSNPLKLFQLSRRVADLFDQYVVYRPEMIEKWVKGSGKPIGDEAWQRTLWGKLSTDQAVIESKKKHETEVVERRPQVFPNRLFVFGLTAIPPIYLDLLFSLAKTRPVHLFLLQPSPEYHSDDFTPKQRARRNITENPTGNPLLTSFGRAEAQFTELLIERDERFPGTLVEKTETFVPPENRSLLGLIQSDIFGAVNRGEHKGADQAKVTVHPDDESLVIHSCYSPLREIEVLYDQLLHLFENDPTLRPRDILVLTPEIEKYSPLIRAVFEYTEIGKRKVPYSISDRHPRSESVVVDSFLQLLELASTRCTSEQVFTLLSSPLIARRFRFSEDDLAQIRTWIRDTGICWGIDTSHRKGLGLPQTDANSWRFGINRLLLGYAMRSQNVRLFENIMAYDEVEGEGGDLLGRLVSVTDTIFEFIGQAQIVRPLKEWGPKLRQLVDQLFASDDEDEIRDLWFLRRTFSRLETIAQDLGGDQALDLVVLRAHLEQVFGGMRQRGGFLTGRVTFCALKPGRSIPARVIFLLGMNDDVFPRRPHPAQFDLMAKWEIGDPSPREDDRYAFLETICAASERLHISYVGRSIIHNEEIPASIVVNELLDYIDQSFALPDGVTALQFAVIQHPLQAFSSKYFSGKGRLFSYSEANAAAANALLHPAAAASPRVFVTPPLPEPAGIERAITLRQLIDFLASPARFFLRARFKFDLKKYDDTLAEDEPIELGPLEKYQIRQELLTERVDTGRSNLKIFTARGLTAPGTLGGLQLRSLDRDATTFYELIKGKISSKRQPPIPVDFKLGDFSLSGIIESIYGDDTVYYRCANLNVRDRLCAWVEHLGRSVAENNRSFKTLLIGKDQTLKWAPLTNAPDILLDLCELYWGGLHSPVPFFPKSGFAYAQAHFERRGNPSKKARDVWNGSRAVSGEKEEPEIQRLFPEADPLDKEFIALAKRVWYPLLRHAGSGGAA
jgi:exodeoxyribonuclease V gamma subunit